MTAPLRTSERIPSERRRTSEPHDDLRVLPATTAALERLAERPTITLAGAMVVMLLVGIADWATGPELAFSAFYLLPVAAVAWASGGVRALLVAGVAAASWLAAEVAAGVEYSSALVPVWNVVVRLLVFAVVARLLTHLRRALYDERELARVDHLTGVSNSRWFAEQGRAALTRPTDHELTLLFLDIDDFKSINDRCGHSGGDHVLRQVGQALRQAVRVGDLVGRLGGDELAVLLSLPVGGASRDAVQNVVDRMRASLAAVQPPVGFSAGAVTFRTPPASIDELIAAADALMYDVKRSGKGAVAHRVVDPDPPETIDLR